MHFHDTGGFDSRPKDILLGRLIIFRTQSIQIVQETVKWKQWEREDCISLIDYRLNVNKFNKWACSNVVATLAGWRGWIVTNSHYAPVISFSTLLDLFEARGACTYLKARLISGTFVHFATLAPNGPVAINVHKYLLMGRRRSMCVLYYSLSDCNAIEFKHSIPLKLAEWRTGVICATVENWNISIVG